MYLDVPPAPPGLIWWKYRPGVPPLPQPAAYFGLANWTDWGWRYDPGYTAPFYKFTDLDKVSALPLPDPLNLDCCCMSVCTCTHEGICPITGTAM